MLKTALPLVAADRDVGVAVVGWRLLRLGLWGHCFSREVLVGVFAHGPVRWWRDSKKQG